MENGLTGELLKREERFEALARQASSSLYLMALRLTKDAWKAEDLVQEAYIRAWRRFDSFESGTNFKAWLSRILEFVYFNERRSAKRREVPADMSMTPRKAETDSEIGDKLKKLIARLPKDERAILLHVAFDGFTYHECADALGIPIGTVMSRLFRARKRIQYSLEETRDEHRL